MKSFSTYLLFIICLTGVCCVSFNASLKLLKQSIEIAISEVDFDDLEEDEVEEKELNEDAKISSSFDQPDFLILIPNDLNLISVDAKVVPSCLNIQSPPPKI